MPVSTVAAPVYIPTPLTIKKIPFPPTSLPAFVIFFLIIVILTGGDRNLKVVLI